MVFYRLNELTARLYAFSQMIFERRLACLGTDTFRIDLEHHLPTYLILMAICSVYQTFFNYLGYGERESHIPYQPIA